MADTKKKTKKSKLIDFKKRLGDARGVGSGDDRYMYAEREYQSPNMRDKIEKPPQFGGRPYSKAALNPTQEAMERSSGARKFSEGGRGEAPNAGIKALREQADGGNKNAKKALQNIGYKNGGCVMTKTNQQPKLV